MSPSPPGRRVPRPWVVGTALLVAVALVLAVVRPWERAPVPDAAPRGPRAVPVELATVERARLAQTVRGIGTLRASATVVIRPEIAGVVRAIHFTEGGPVRQGQVLFELEDEALVGQMASRRAALRAAEATVEDARRTWERQRELFARDLIARADAERAQTELQRATAELDRLRAELGLAETLRRETRLRAPFAGLISERAVDRGAYVTAGQALATIYQVDPLELEFFLPERHIGAVRRGQAVAVTIAAYHNRAFQGQVDFVSPAVREATRDFLLKATIPNPEGLLRPGAFATALVTVDVREDRPVVPEEALVATRLGYLVFVVEDGIAHTREVRIGLRQNGLVEVLDGVAAGERVVRAGHLRLSGGDPVEAVGGEPPAERTE
jgi:membrane fusion protein, multidrug efflux system